MEKCKSRSCSSARDAEHDGILISARMVATLSTCMKDAPTMLLSWLEEEFCFLINKKDQTNIEIKIKNIRYIGELCKFKVAPAGLVFSCIKGPYITTGHSQLCKNTIKVLCNADVSEGIFVRGKDVSLPETTIRIPKRPLRYVGGKPVSQRFILAFFAGLSHGRVRPVLHKYWDGKDEDMRIYGPLPLRVSRNMSYIHHMKASRFCICSMGFEVNSPRIVEAIYYECVPVIIADNFVLPFDQVLDWSAFSVVVAEKDIPNLKNILTGISLRKYINLHTNVQVAETSPVACKANKV